MDKALLQLHEVRRVPVVRTLSPGRPFTWLRLGWEDLRANPGASLAHGAILVAIGALMLLTFGTHIHLIALIAATFLLMGPIAAAAFYEISRTREQGRVATFDSSLLGAVRRSGALAGLGVFLGILVGLWAWMSATLFGFSSGIEVPSIGSDGWRSVIGWRYPGMVLAYSSTGVGVAAVAFVTSAFAAPAIFGTGISLTSAMALSIRAVLGNPVPMLVWATLVGGLTVAGLVGGLVGLVVILPWLGHATWHAYRDVVGDR